MRKILVPLLLALPFASAITWAQDAADTMERPSLSTSRSVTVTAEVTAINHETRVVTVLRGDGSEVTFTATLRNIHRKSAPRTKDQNRLSRCTAMKPMFAASSPVWASPQ